MPSLQRHSEHKIVPRIIKALARDGAQRRLGEQVQRRQIEQIVDRAGGLRQAFPLLIPPRPYCADHLPGRLLIRPRKSALKRTFIFS